MNFLKELINKFNWDNIYRVLIYRQFGLALSECIKEFWNNKSHISAMSKEM